MKKNPILGFHEPCLKTRLAEKNGHKAVILWDPIADQERRVIGPTTVFAILSVKEDPLKVISLNEMMNILNAIKDRFIANFP